MKKLAIIATAFLLVFSACNNDEEEEVTPTVSGPTKPTNIEVYSDASGITIGGPNYDGVLSAHKLRTIAYGVDTTTFASSAAFYPYTGNYYNTINAGNVSVNNKRLVEYGSYYYGPDTNQTYNFTNSIAWNVAGGNGFTPFNTTINGFPMVPEFSANESINRQSTYSISLFNGTSVNCDIILVTIVQDGEPKAYQIIYTNENIPNSISFRSPQLQGLEETDMMLGNFAILQVAYYNSFENMEGTKNILYHNVSSTTTILEVE